jgi:hypothetical protein
MKKIVIVERELQNAAALSEVLKKHSENGDQIIVCFGRTQGKSHLVEEILKQFQHIDKQQPHLSVNAKRAAFGIPPIEGVQSKTTKKKDKKIKLSATEIQSGLSRVDWAEKLITLLPQDHEARNSWLLNYGQGVEARHLRNTRHLLFDSSTQSAHLIKKDE